MIASWPKGAAKPTIPLPYSQETMNGFEYAAAVQMIQSGLVEEGMTVVEAVRDRYDGEKRNPWNEFEYGSNYARSMASYSLLNAFAGFQFDMVCGMISFNPIQPRDDRFQCFWSLDSGWGEFETQRGQAEVRLLGGELRLQVLNLPWIAPKKVQAVILDGESVPFAQDAGEVHFKHPVRIRKGQTLQVTVEAT